MATIGLIAGFKNIEVGERQLLRVKRVSYDPKFQKASITFEDESGGTLTETYAFMGKKKGEVNEVALGIFSTICKCVTHDFRDREIDPEIIKGGYIVADVYEQAVEQRDSDGEVIGTRRYTHLRNYREAEAAFADDESMEGYL